MKIKWIKVVEQEPTEGEDCLIHVETILKASYYPACEIFPWLLDDDFSPHSEVRHWVSCKEEEEEI